MGNKQTIFTEEQLDNYQVSPRPSPRLSVAAAPPPLRKPAPGVTSGLCLHSERDLGPRLLKVFTAGETPGSREAAQESPLL